MVHDVEWDDHAHDWDERDATRAYATAAFSSLQEILESFGVALPSSKVLDFGCGTGLLTEQLAEAGTSVHAVDNSRAMLDVLARKAAQRRWTNVQISAELPVISPKLDLIVCSSVCSFLDDYPGTVSDLVELLGPGGLFIQWDWERTGDDPGGISRQEISNALSQAGLSEVSVRTGFSISVDGQKMSPLVGFGRL